MEGIIPKINKSKGKKKINTAIKVVEELRKRGEHFIVTLEMNSELLNDYRKREQVREYGEQKIAISGYLHGLRDCGVISEYERSVLYVYYTTKR